MEADRRTRESVIRTYLSNGKVTKEQLEEAVRFFLSGPGKGMVKPCSPEEWKKLVTDAGLDPGPDFHPMDFRP